MKRHILALASVILLAFIGQNAQAAVVVDPSFWTGTRTAQAGGGITAFDEWAGTNANEIVQLSYSVTQNGGLYTYTYTISGLGGVNLRKAVSHAIFETSLTFTSENLKPGSSGQASIGWEDDGVGNNNPGLAVNSIYGIYFDFGGNMDTCIALRTLVIQGDKAYVQAGAGIVADSVPANEWNETLNKARGLLKAIEIAEARVKDG